MKNEIIIFENQKVKLEVKLRVIGNYTKALDLLDDYDFVDGNKRIAATLFIYFLKYYDILYNGTSTNSSRNMVKTN